MTTPAGLTAYLLKSWKYLRWTGATPTTPLGGTPANINDNTPATTSSCGGMNLTGLPVGSCIIAKLDFGAQKLITKIDAKAFKNNNSVFGGNGFYTSLDGTTWTLFGSTFNVTTVAGDMEQFGEIKARYVALAIPPANWAIVTFTLGDLNAYTSV